MYKRQDLEDIEGDAAAIKKVLSSKYVGDILSSDAKNILNIQDRCNRGAVAVIQICDMLDNMFLGCYYYEAAAVLRASLLLSTLLSNSEAWVNLSTTDVEKLERIDEQFLRKIFCAPISTPRVLLYTETGATPIRFILMSRRLNGV